MNDHSYGHYRMEEKVMPLIELSVEKAVFILVDQLESLGSGHIGGKECPNEENEGLENCPPEHFDCGEDIEDVFLRQAIIRDIQEFLKRVELVGKFYAAQKAMKFLYGDDYPKRIEETKPVIEAIQQAYKCDVVKATQKCVEKIIKWYPHDNGVRVALLLATAVEMVEPEQRS